MKIEKLKPGMIVYDVHKTRMGNTTVSTVGVWEVLIKAVDIENGIVTASWNSNSPKDYHAGTWSKWRANKPMLMPTWGGAGKRLATREEIAEAKRKAVRNAE